MARQAPTITVVLPHREVFGFDGAGAVAMVVRRLVAGPSRYRTRVAGPPVPGAPFPGTEFLPVPAWRGLPLTATQAYTVRLARVLMQVAPGPIEVHNKPDVAAWLARLFRSRPVSLFLHNDPRSMRGARSPSARQHLLNGLAGVVTVSDFLRRAMLDGIGPAPVRMPVVIHNALDPSELPSPLPMPRRNRVILFAGRVVPDKAPDAFVAACALALPELPGWRAEVIGADGFSAGAPDSGFISMLRPAAAAAGVALLGLRPHAEVLRAMSQAAIVVVPSRWAEPFGLTALEALACGAALACSGRGGLTEVMGDAAVRIDPDDSASMANVLVRLAKDAKLRVRLSEAGMRRASEHFNAAAAIARLDEERDRVLREFPF